MKLIGWVKIIILLGEIQGKLTGKEAITAHWFEDQADLLDSSPTSCGVGALGVDLSRVTSIAAMETCDCLQCIAITSHNAKVYVMVVDTGGNGLDLSRTAFSQLADGEISGHVQVEWEPAPLSKCDGILPSEGPNSYEKLINPQCKSNNLIPSEPSDEPNKNPGPTSKPNNNSDPTSDEPNDPEFSINEPKDEKDPIWEPNWEPNWETIRDSDKPLELPNPEINNSEPEWEPIIEPNFDNNLFDPDMQFENEIINDSNLYNLDDTNENNIITDPETKILLHELFSIPDPSTNQPSSSIQPIPESIVSKNFHSLTHKKTQPTDSYLFNDDVSSNSLALPLPSKYLISFSISLFMLFIL